MIIFEDVAFRYTDSEEAILHDVNFSLESGSYHFLSGPSGSGKTSLMKLMYLGALPTAGKITMFDRKIHTLGREELFKMRQRIGVVFQDFRLLNHLSAFDNVALPLRVARRPDDEIQKHVTELLDWVGLGDCKDKLPRMLSGGQQQRIAIARAVITQPKLLLADEPTGNLDDEIGYRLMGLFEQLNRMGTTIVIATHNASIIEQFGHPCLRLTQGTIHQEKPRGIGRIRNVF
ncbi:MAG: ATP-binding cassette domain-containing protein [Alphaproteobacteria bacterium]|nr:ATP-binding cassette domain-containing protein [Alphaproteobacteria bacterium]